MADTAWEEAPNVAIPLNEDGKQKVSRVNLTSYKEKLRVLLSDTIAAMADGHGVTAPIRVPTGPEIQEGTDKGRGETELQVTKRFRTAATEMRETGELVLNGMPQSVAVQFTHIAPQEGETPKTLLELTLQDAKEITDLTQQKRDFGTAAKALNEAVQAWQSNQQDPEAKARVRAAIVKAVETQKVAAAGVAADPGENGQGHKPDLKKKFDEKSASVAELVKRVSPHVQEKPAPANGASKSNKQAEKTPA